MSVKQPKHKILIVDDMALNIKILGESLRKNYEIVVTTSGKKALEIATSETPPDLILLDILMHGMDGHEVCKILKGDERTKNIPVIFISSRGEMEDETKGLELGAVDYIIKPFSMPIVNARIKTHLSLKMKNDMLESLVSIDRVTDIPNRRKFDELLDREWYRTRRAAQPISLILMDIDFFKNFNDNYGYADGNACLKNVAQVLENTINRPADFIARYSSYKFAAALPETNSDSAVAVGGMIQADVKNMNIPHSFSQVSDKVTLSLGVATIIPSKDTSKTSSSPDDLIKAADSALCKAKEHGRNQIKSIYVK